MSFLLPHEGAVVVRGDRDKLVHRATEMAGQLRCQRTSSPLSVSVRCNAVAARLVAVSESRCNLYGNNGERQEGSLTYEVQATQAVWKEDHMNFRGKYITVGRSRRCDKTDGNFKK